MSFSQRAPRDGKRKRLLLVKTSCWVICWGEIMHGLCSFAPEVFFLETWQWEEADDLHSAKMFQRTSSSELCSCIANKESNLAQIHKIQTKNYPADTSLFITQLQQRLRIFGQWKYKINCKAVTLSSKLLMDFFCVISNRLVEFFSDCR